MRRPDPTKRSLHPPTRRLDFDHGGFADPVAADRRHHNRRNHPHVVRPCRTGADLIDAFEAIPADNDRAASIEHDDMKRPLESAPVDEAGEQLGKSFVISIAHPHGRRA
jgi:hypothetical protein